MNVSKMQKQRLATRRTRGTHISDLPRVSSIIQTSSRNDYLSLGCSQLNPHLPSERSTEWGSAGVEPSCPDASIMVN